MEKREHKYRAWNSETNKMMYWEDILRFKNLMKLLSLNHITVEQYTGLKDKNGKEIYESDIHKTEPMDIDGKMQSSYLPIVFDNGAFWIDESFDKDGTYLTLLCEYDEPLNIVGNIHENKDLI